MKRVMMLIMLAGVSLAVNGRDITTTTGTVYKDVEITNTSPVEITIMYDDSKGNPVLRGIELKDLPENIQREFNYTQVRADEFKKHAAEYRELTYEKALQKAIANAAVEKATEERNKQIDHIQALVHGQRQQIELQVIRPIKGGCIGYAAAPIHNLNTGKYGIYYVRDVRCDNGQTWQGDVYPTGGTITIAEGNVPVFNSSFAQAVAEACEAGNVQK
jgi:hypothetical protein